MRYIIVSVMVMFLIGIGSTSSFAQVSYKLEQKTKKTLVVGVGELVARFEKRRPLKNAFGKNSLFRPTFHSFG